MKALLLEEGLGSTIYGGALAQGFENCNVEVTSYKWSICNHDDASVFHNFFLRPYVYYKKIENRLAFGFLINKVNLKIKIIAKNLQPDFVFIYRGTHIYPSTVKYLKEDLGLVVFGYNNDDPFSLNYPSYYWRHYLKSLPYYSHVFSYREKNITDYSAIGIKSSLLRSYYLKDHNYPIESKLIVGKFISDVSFIGHYEADGRDEVLLYLLRNGIALKIYGPEWHRSVLYSQLVDLLGYEIEPLKGNDYNLAINSSKIALVFLSKINNDTYTRRCFEIPATKTMMLAEKTADLTSLFLAGEEADFFNSKEELLEKIQFYLLDGRYLNAGLAGYSRVKNDGHEVVDRCRKIIECYKKLIL